MQEKFDYKQERFSCNRAGNEAADQFQKSVKRKTVSRKGAKKKTQRACGTQQLGVLPLRLCANCLSVTGHSPEISN
ncbi:MAG TPA: hypothetical protein VGC91_16570 [Pyrinomonadaceae bacterium]|jgi:hypothetical protein